MSVHDVRQALLHLTIMPWPWKPKPPDLLRWTFTMAAPDNAVFSAAAFDKQIGRTIAVVHKGETRSDATLVAAKVSKDGRTVTLTLSSAKIPDDVQFLTPPAAFLRK